MTPEAALTIMRGLLIASSAFVGAVVASYLGVVAERGWAGSARGRSVCVCGRTLTWWENVPVLSWVGLRGRSRCCRVALPVRYVATEAALALTCALGAAFAGVVGAVVALALGGAATLWASRRHMHRQS